MEDIFSSMAENLDFLMHAYVIHMHANGRRPWDDQHWQLNNKTHWYHKQFGKTLDVEFLSPSLSLEYEEFMYWECMSCILFDE